MITQMYEIAMNNLFTPTENDYLAIGFADFRFHLATERQIIHTGLSVFQVTNHWRNLINLTFNYSENL